MAPESSSQIACYAQNIFFALARVKCSVLGPFAILITLAGHEYRVNRLSSAALAEVRPPLVVDETRMDWRVRRLITLVKLWVFGVAKRSMQTVATRVPNLNIGLK